MNPLLQQSRPTSIRSLELPRRERYYPSPEDWRNEILYFLIPDRFSDGREATRPLLDRERLAEIRAAAAGGWNWQKWQQSGSRRWQGGTIRGIESKLPYLAELGVTSIWVGPIFRQRINHDGTYHGYAIQDFLDVDPHLGTREDLVHLVEAAHARGMRIILDVIFNHSGPNWVYPGHVWEPPYREHPDRYEFGQWVAEDGRILETGEPLTADGDGILPVELRDPEAYTRAGRGDLGIGDIAHGMAQHKRSDFPGSLRDFNLDVPEVLDTLIQCYKYWIALTDCDGFRIDTLKHVADDHARRFCGAIKEYAMNLGKNDFFLVGEAAGGDFCQDHYLDILEHNMNAALDIGEARLALAGLARGELKAMEYFCGFDLCNPVMRSHRNLGWRHVSILDDHDHVAGPKTRFSARAESPHQVFAPTAVQLLTLGIPCIYYGSEQAIGAVEPQERQWLSEWGSCDVFLREAMFGPEHPLKLGHAGLSNGSSADSALHGFGPSGTSGHHCFDEQHPAYLRIGALARIRQSYPVLRYGRQYLRSTSILGGPFGETPPGELVGWSRILDDEEALCILNSNPRERRGADIQVDRSLSGGRSMRVIFNSAEVADDDYDGAYRVGDEIEVQANGVVSIQDVGPSEVIVLINRP
jgi:glycosidase